MESDNIENKQNYMAPFCTQLKMLLFRARALAKREPAAVMGRFGASAFMSLLMISIYYQANDDSSSSGGHLPIPDMS